MAIGARAFGNQQVIFCLGRVGYERIPIWHLSGGSVALFGHEARTIQTPWNPPSMVGGERIQPGGLLEPAGDCGLFAMRSRIGERHEA